MNTNLVLRKYSIENLPDWNAFIATSRNGTFLFNRAYMDYHADRFTDHSYLIYRKNKLKGVIPGNRNDDVFYSHQGLTYGGVISSADLSTQDMLEVFSLLNEDLRASGFQKVVYKPVPAIYHQLPAEEDLYALFRQQATLIARGISSAIMQNLKIPFIESRKSGIRKALRENVTLTESGDYGVFWQILTEVLQSRHGVKPVHSLPEITLLHQRFPDKIRLHLAWFAGQVVAGVLMYADRQVAHVQYIGASEEGKKCGALDLLFDQLINEIYTGYPVFDFGISTEQGGQVLNEALIFQKEGFGGRGIAYDCYQYQL